MKSHVPLITVILLGLYSSVLTNLMKLKPHNFHAPKKTSTKKKFLPQGLFKAESDYQFEHFPIVYLDPLDLKDTLFNFLDKNYQELELVKLTDDLIRTV